MTQKTQELLAELERTLEQWPEDEQERIVSSYLEALHQRKQRTEGKQEGEGELYDPFQVMLDANLDLPSDYSETYEEHLYGAETQND